MNLPKPVYEFIPYFCIGLGLSVGIFGITDPTTKLHFLEHAAAVILVVIGVLIIRMRAEARSKAEGFRLAKQYEQRSRK